MNEQTPAETGTISQDTVTAPTPITSRKKLILIIGGLLFIFILSCIFFYIYKKDTQPTMQKPQVNTTENSSTSTTTITSLADLNKNTQQSKTSSSTILLPELAQVSNPEAKKIIEDYYTTIKPSHDELAKQIPGGIVTYKGNTPNVSPELAKKWDDDGKKIDVIFNKLETLNTHTLQTALTLNSWNANSKVYVNGKLVMEDSANGTSKMSIDQLMGSDDFRQYLGLRGQENLFVLKKGSNTVKITYTLPSIVKERNEGVVSVMNISPVSLTVQRMEKLKTGAFTGMFETKDEILNLEEKPTRIENGDPEKASGELVGTFILK